MSQHWPGSEPGGIANGGVAVFLDQAWDEFGLQGS